MTELPVTAWYMDIAAKGKSIWRDCPTDLKQDLLFFLDHGYVVLKQSVPSDVISRARAEFEAHKTFYSADYEKHKDANGFQRRLVNWHCLLDGFKDLFAKNSGALALQDYIFRRPAVCYTSLTFESGSEQDIHRDTPYFTTTPEYYYLGVWVAMEHVDDRNGALMVYDGGHLVPEPDRGEIVSRYYKHGEAIDPFDPRLWNDYQASVENECEARGLEKKTVSMEPGDTLIWHPHLPHH